MVSEQGGIEEGEGKRKSEERNKREGKELG
jgi:hypothetical protein